MTAAASPAPTQATEPTTSPDPAPAKLRLPPEEITALLARGDSFWAIKDISSARLLYERAADAGDGRAALKLGRTFDPAVLYFAHLAGRGDQAIADFWYRRARELGEPEADVRKPEDRP
jgi:TPR repeat protein